LSEIFKENGFCSLSESILCDLNWDQILIDCQILAGSLNTIYWVGWCHSNTEVPSLNLGWITGCSDAAVCGNLSGDLQIVHANMS